MELFEGGQEIPMTVLTGFLGSGKTTLLNRILTGDHGLRVAVLVNDFGSINIDAELVVGVEENMISLANGCVCCQIRDDLIEAVEDILARQETIEYILLEASGVAEPSGIFATFANPSLRDRIRLDSITCVVDAEQVFAHPEYPGLQELKMRQIAFADMVVLNKVDLAGPEQVERVKAWIDDRINRIRIVETSFCDVPNHILLGVGRFDYGRAALASKGNGHDNHTDHGQTFSTWSYESDQPVSLDALRLMAKKLPGSIYRCKGVVFAAEAPERRAVLQVVGRRADVALFDEWGERTPRTQIVAIGAPGSIDAEALTAQFDACIHESAVVS
jgi:G3E family GTPase